MTSQLFLDKLTENFPYDATVNQQQFFEEVTDFVSNKQKNSLFILTGYAGTGKTSVLATLVKTLPSLPMNSVLMAPTGRASKVMNNYSGIPAYTIHRKIYRPKKKPNGTVQFSLQQNKHKNTLFIVDESSMISNHLMELGGNQSSSLLEDLIQYVYSGENCFLLLVGDPAQLPPVGIEESPALDRSLMERQFNLNISSLLLEEVMRQEAHSGVLYNATQIRNCIEYSNFNGYRFKLESFKDIIRLQNGFEIQEAIHEAYSKHGINETTIVVRTNKRANKYNEQIRSRILFREHQICTGDYLMVVKNNYFWLEQESHAGFIANGDLIELLEIYKHYDLYGFSFVRVKIRMVDYPDVTPFETILLLDTLSMDTPALSSEAAQRLFQEVVLDYAHEGARYKQIAKVKQNEFFNALQVKFAYAVTCHKAQGGQWDVVFIDQPYLPQGMDREYFRWLYTSLTRAKEKVYLLGFEPEYF